MKLQHTQLETPLHWLQDHEPERRKVQGRFPRACLDIPSANKTCTGNLGLDVQLCQAARPALEQGKQRRLVWLLRQPLVVAVHRHRPPQALGALCPHHTQPVPAGEQPGLPVAAGVCEGEGACQDGRRQVVDGQGVL